MTCLVPVFFFVFFLIKIGTEYFFLEILHIGYVHNYFGKQINFTTSEFYMLTKFAFGIPIYKPIIYIDKIIPLSWAMLYQIRICSNVSLNKND